MKTPLTSLCLFLALVVAVSSEYDLRGVWPNVPFPGAWGKVPGDDQSKAESVYQLYKQGNLPGETESHPSESAEEKDEDKAEYQPHSPEDESQQSEYQPHSPEDDSEQSEYQPHSPEDDSEQSEYQPHSPEDDSEQSEYQPSYESLGSTDDSSLENQTIAPEDELDLPEGHPYHSDDFLESHPNMDDFLDSSDRYSNLAQFFPGDEEGEFPQDLDSGRPTLPFPPHELLARAVLAMATMPDGGHGMKEGEGEQEEGEEVPQMPDIKQAALRAKKLLHYLHRHMMTLDPLAMLFRARQAVDARVASLDQLDSAAAVVKALEQDLERTEGQVISTLESLHTRFLAGTEEGPDQGEQQEEGQEE